MVLRLGLVAVLALLALVPIASGSHDPDAWFAGKWHMVFPDEPTEGPLSLELVSEPEMRKELAGQGFRHGSYLTGNCTDGAKTQYYTGEATRGPDSGPIVACTNSRSGLIYAIFKSMYKVEVAISWPRGTSALATSFNLPNGPVAHWNIFFNKHFSTDGSQTEEYVTGLKIVPEAGDTTGGATRLTVIWSFQVRGMGGRVALGGFGRVSGKTPAKLQTIDVGAPNNLIKWNTSRGETLLDVTGGSYSAQSRNGRTTKTLILKVSVVTSAVNGCKKGASGSVRLFLAGAGANGPDATVARNVCGQEDWTSKR
jgi:hypothetical protein